MKVVKNKKESEKTIFVSIASYRDPELLPTLTDLFKNATHPENLKVCVAWQHDKKDEWDTLGKFAKDERVIVLDIPYEEAKGVCHARNKIQTYYADEDYYFQLDSHHRFVKGWDTKVKKMINQLQKKGIEKPLITGYIPSYFPKTDPKGRTQEIWAMNFDRFTPEGYIFTRPSHVDNWKELTEPFLTRFLSGHFIFTLGKWAVEVPYDPLLYFHGEEPSLAVRSYTWGYDLFHPHEIIAWHEYTREGKTKHWDDDKEWNEKDEISHYRYRKLHGMDGENCSDCAVKELLPYVFGKVRTLDDYERYAGIRFADRGVQKYTLDRKIPPNPPYYDYDCTFKHMFKHCIDIHTNDIPSLDYDFWVVSFEKEDGTVIYRQDADENEVTSLLQQLNKSEWVQLWREYSGDKPYKYVVWMHSKKEGFGKRIEKII